MGIWFIATNSLVLLMYRLLCSKPALADKAAQMVKKSRHVQQMLLLLAVLGTSMTIGDGVMTATASGVSPCGKLLNLNKLKQMCHCNQLISNCCCLEVVNISHPSCSAAFDSKCCNVYHTTYTLVPALEGLMTKLYPLYALLENYDSCTLGLIVYHAFCIRAMVTQTC